MTGERVSVGNLVHPLDAQMRIDTRVAPRRIVLVWTSARGPMVTLEDGESLESWRVGKLVPINARRGKATEQAL